ncbi:MAG: right-handed parallel beta-helix repeat-containing protein [Treponema sp.]|nr:right-handed parallel beta-helix repeat-containing protein [Treponema sp.]
MTAGLCCAAVFLGAAFSACKNPYMIHNLARPVVLTAIEFRTDKDLADTPAYPLKPVFASAVTDYAAYVHEKAEFIYPIGHPEEGASVEFGECSYILPDGGPVTVYPANGGYPFPPAVTRLEVVFRVYKDHRLDGVYKVLVMRRPDPARLSGLSVTVADYTIPKETSPGVSNPVYRPEDPADPGWKPDPNNYLLYFDPAGTEYTITIPYYSRKVILEPVKTQDILVRYTVYPGNPDYYPETAADLKWENSTVPQDIDYTGCRQGDYGGEHYYQDPQKSRYLYVDPPVPDAVTGQGVSYVILHTIMKDPGTGNLYYPQDYKLKLVWEKTYAYLNNLSVKDDVAPATERRIGSFFPANTGYEAELDRGAVNFTVSAEPRDGGAEVKYELFSSMENTSVPLATQTGGAATFPFPEKVRAVRITVQWPPATPHPSFNAGNEWGKITYWVNVRRSEAPTKLVNIIIEGYVPALPAANRWVELFVYDKSLSGVWKPQVTSTPYSSLKDPVPPSSADLDLETVNNFTLEVEGTQVTRLRFTGVPSAAADPNPAKRGSVTYNVGDDPAWPPAKQETDFNGGLGVTITTKEPDMRDRVYAFTIIRAGAQVLETWTDTRAPPSNGDSITGNPAINEPDPVNNQIRLNNSDRGTFQTIVGSRVVNNAMPGSTVTVRITPKLGWQLDKLWFIKETVTPRTLEPFNALPGATAPPFSPGVWEGSFPMPNEAVKLVATYKYVTGKIDRVAYVAPEGKAGRTGYYGQNEGNSIDTLTGTAWAYATSNLQGVINKFTFGSGSFDEIWVMEGTYRLDPPSGASTTDSWWSEDITERGSDLNRSFVLKPGLRIYGGFKGTEGNINPALVQAARASRNSDKAAALRTILSGTLRNGGHVRHVVVAAGIIPSGGNVLAGSPELRTSTAYNFKPAEDGAGIFGGAGVTLLDTLTIRDGLRTKEGGPLTIRGKQVDNNNGAGLYNTDASPYLRNVVFSDNTAVKGGGMYTEGTSYPVLQSVTFNNNDVTGFNDVTGDGGGLYAAGGLPGVLDCLFENNATVGGNGAGLYAAGGSKVLLRRAEFRYNTATSGGGLYNAAETWVYQSTFHHNTAYGAGGAIGQSGNLYLVNVTVNNNNGGLNDSGTENNNWGIDNNGGTLTGTNLTVRNSGGGISNSSRLALVNSLIKDNGTGVSASGPSVLTNVVFENNTGTGLVFSVSQGEKEPGGTALGGCIVTNASFINNGTGISASYRSSYDFHHGAANLLLNSVFIRGGGTGISITNGAVPEAFDGKNGIYVTANNVTVTGPAGTGLTSSSANIAVPEQSKYDMLDLRMRNSVLFGNTVNTGTNSRRIIGRFGGNVTLSAGNQTLNMTPDKAALFALGDTFRVVQGSPTAPPPDTASWKNSAVYTVTGVSPSFAVNASGGPHLNGGSVTYTASDYIVKTVYRPIGSAGLQGGFSAGPGRILYMNDSPNLGDLTVGKVFKLFRISDGTAGSSVNVVTAKSSEKVVPPIPSNARDRGEVDDLSALNTLSDLQNRDWAFNRDTQTLWRYNGTVWINTTIRKMWQITFTASAGGSFGPNTHELRINDIDGGGSRSVYLPGNVSWLKSLVGGVDKAPLADLAGPIGWDDLLPSTGAVFTGNYRPGADLKDKGSGAAYPDYGSETAAITALLNQCFKRCDDAWGGNPTTDLRNFLRSLFENNLFVWNGPEGTGNLSAPVDITVFLQKDNGFNAGDPRVSTSINLPQNRKVGGEIDVGAYEQ